MTKSKYCFLVYSFTAPRVPLFFHASLPYPSVVAFTFVSIAWETTTLTLESEWYSHKQEWRGGGQLACAGLSAPA